MSEENVEVVRRGFMAAGREDWRTALDTVHPEAAILDYDVPDAGTYHGHAGFLKWLANWDAGWDTWRIEDSEFRAAGDEGAIAVFRSIAKGKGSGIEIERHDAIVYEVRNGKIERLEYFNDQGRALQAAGLSE